MTIRPFKISNGNVVITRIQTHRGEDLIQKSIKIPHKFWKKLLSHPITAFGYSIGHIPENKQLPNPKFDKFQVIKALDFWIEYFVYQNKCDYILEGTVSTEFELHLEELIRVREAVMKESIDTKYVRQKIRATNEDTRSMNFQKGRYYYRFQNGYLDTNMRPTEVTKYSKSLGIEFPKPLPPKQIPPDQIIEFTENVLDASNSPFSTVDQFCYVVRKMTYKKYLEHNKPKLYNKDLAQSVTPQSGRLSRMISNMIEAQTRFNFEENFRDDGPRFNFGDVEPSAMMRGGRHTDDGPRDFSIAVREPALGTEPAHPSTTATDGFFVLPVDATAQSVTIQDDEEPRAIGMMGEEGMITNIVGAAGEQLEMGDLIFMDNNNARWYKATRFGPTPTHINIRLDIGPSQMVEAVREGTFIYPPRSIVTLTPGDSHMGLDSNENVIIRRNMRN